MAPRIQLLECRVAIHFVELASARGDMIRLEESVNVSQCQFADPQSSSLTVEGDCNKHCGRVGGEEPWRGDLELLLPGLWSL